ncbi:TetR/AcrR family transcriptional regulator [Paenibacillus nicotianae]|uniref:TetR/AcrR family transcriptional regulator n=1 Tax=Paenibacillus nicotianae TaxID=1526551 RepID=A0ABW4UVC5_9BACL
MNHTYTMIEQIKLLFVTKGYEETSEQDMIEICSLTQADFAHQFKSKDHVFCLVLDIICQEIDDLIFNHYTDQQVIPEQKIIAYIQSYMQHITIVYPHLQQNSVSKQNRYDNPAIHYAYQRLEYRLSTLLLEMMNSILYELDDTNLLGWNKDHLHQQIKQSHSMSLSQALDIQQSLYHSKILVHSKHTTIYTKRAQWRKIRHVEQEIMNTTDRCILVNTLLQCIEKYPIKLLDSVKVTEQRPYELH